MTFHKARPSWPYLLPLRSLGAADSDCSIISTAMEDFLPRAFLTKVAYLCAG
jgi:hypothetical protein